MTNLIFGTLSLNEALPLVSCTGRHGPAQVLLVRYAVSGQPLSLFSVISPFLSNKMPGKINLRCKRVGFYKPRTNLFSSLGFLGFPMTWGWRYEGGRTSPNSALPHQQPGNSLDRKAIQRVNRFATAKPKKGEPKEIIP